MATPSTPRSSNPRLSRRGFLAAGACLTLAACGIPGRRMTRIGFMGTVRNDSGLEALKQALATRGYAEGKSYEVIERYVGDTGDTYEQLADDLVQHQVDVVASNFDYSSALSRVAPLPVVLIGTANPVVGGLAQTMDHPGGTITGVLGRPQAGLLNVHVDLLMSLIPNLRRVTFVPPFQLNGQMFGETPVSIANVSSITGVQVHVIPNRVGTALRDPTSLFQDAGRAGAEAIILAIPSYEPEQLAQTAIRQQLPILYQGNPDYPRKYGGLMSQGVSPEDVFRRAGLQLAKILDGLKPGDLPIEEPDKFDLIVNLSAAQALGITIPQAILNQATEVIP